MFILEIFLFIRMLTTLDMLQFLLRFHWTSVDMCKTVESFSYISIGANADLKSLRTFLVFLPELMIARNRWNSYHGFYILIEANDDFSLLPSPYFLGEMSWIFLNYSHVNKRVISQTRIDILTPKIS